MVRRSEWWVDYNDGLANKLKAIYIIQNIWSAKFIIHYEVLSDNVYIHLFRLTVGFFGFIIPDETTRNNPGGSPDNSE